MASSFITTALSKLMLFGMAPVLLISVDFLMFGCWEFIVDIVPEAVAVVDAIPLELEVSAVVEEDEEEEEATAAAATSISPRSIAGVLVLVVVVVVLATTMVATASLEAVAASPEPLSSAELSVLEAILAALAWDKILAELLTFTTPILEDAEPASTAEVSSEPSGII